MEGKIDGIAGVFITLEKDDWTTEVKKIALNAKKFKEAGSAEKFPRLQKKRLQSPKAEVLGAVCPTSPVYPELS